MLKFTRKNKKLVIPVGINPSYNIDSSTLYNTTDADVVANDILEGKIAYGSDGKVVGTLDLESEKATSYNEGYQAGESAGYQDGLEIGYQNGFDNGIIEQKRLLTNITITENGTYAREDGYNEVIVEVPDLNGDYNEGYNEGIEEQKAKLETITITENGTYNREDGYNEVIVEVPDLNGDYNEGYNEGIEEQKSKLETITITENGTYTREDGYNEVIVEVPDLNGDYNEGYSDGVIAGREEIITEQSDATITPQTVIKGEIGYGANNERIVGEFEFVEGFNFGKIGYSQELSNELNSITAENIAYSKQLYDAWDPNRTSAQGYFQNNKSLVYAPNVNCSNIVNGCQSMFYSCSNLTTVPALNTSNCQYFGNMFAGCSNLTTVGLIDTSSAKAMDSMFSNCSKLTIAPALNTSNVTNMGNMFGYCTSLTSVPEYDTSNVTSVISMFYYYSSGVPTTDLGGFINLGKSFSYFNGDQNHLNLTTMNKLTYESCMNVINKVYDMNLTNVINAKISFNATTKALLSADDIAIATSKGWTIQ